MTDANEIVNRVANSPLVTFDLEEYYQPGERVVLDIKEQLYEGLMVKEKDFREFVRTHNWSQYQDKFVAVTCSSDAIVPIWAYMLVGISLCPHATMFVYGSLERLEEKLFEEAMQKINWDRFSEKKVVVKGCSKVDVPLAAYLEAVRHLQPVVISLMFGEPCSTVPLFKARKSSSESLKG
jgi:hypothetical protein